MVFPLDFVSSLNTWFKPEYTKHCLDYLGNKHYPLTLAPKEAVPVANISCQSQRNNPPEAYLRNPSLLCQQEHCAKQRADTPNSIQAKMHWQTNPFPTPQLSQQLTQCPPD